MKVVKEGITPPNTYTGTCTNCNCQFECEHRELPYRYGFWDFLLWVFDYEQRRLPYMNCPNYSKQTKMVKIDALSPKDDNPIPN